MKNNKFAKISLLILSLALCIGTMLVMSIGAAESETENKTPEIISQNVAYTDKFSLMYAVDAATVTEAPVTLYLYNAMPAGIETPYNDKYTADNITSGKESGLGVDAYIFTTDGVGATAMTQEFFVVAEDAKGNRSEVKKYSVAEYLYERLASGRASDDQEEFYLNTINFGANAQIVLAKEGENPQLISDYSYVIVEGVAQGIYPVGTKLNPYVNAITANWNVTATAEDGTETTELCQRGFTVPDAIKTVATVESKQEYRAGVDTFSDCIVDGKSVSVGTGAKSADGNFACSSGTLYYEYANDSDRGVLTKVTATNNPRFIMLNNSALKDVNEATAYELSFDIKLVMDGNELPGESVNYRLYLWHNNTAFSDQIYMYYSYSTAGEGQMRIYDADGGRIINYDATDWMHIRLVVYENDNKYAYLYLNGDSEAAGKMLLKSSYTGLDYMTGGGIINYSSDGNGEHINSFLVDNVFCGLIKE